MKWLLTVCLVLIFTPAQAQSPLRPDVPPQAEEDKTEPQGKIHDLRELLRDPDVRHWIDARDAQATGAAQDPAPGAGHPAGMPSALATWEGQARGRIQTVVSAMPHIVPEIGKAFGRLQGDIFKDGHVPLLAFSLLVLAGTIVEWLFRRKWWRHRDGVEDYLPIAIFAVIMTILFFAIAWPQPVRLVVACYLTAFVSYRLVVAAVKHLAPPKLRGRLNTSAGLFLFVTASTTALIILEVDPDVLEAIVMLASFMVLALAIELVWTKASWHSSAKAALSLYLGGIWFLWCLELDELFWLCIYIIVLPFLLQSISHNVREKLLSSFQIQPSDSRSVVLVRGSRALIFALALAWIALVWEMDAQSIGHGDPRTGTVFYGLLRSVFILLLADLVWHLAKAAIDRNLSLDHGHAPTENQPETGNREARATRLHTLLPILRNVLAVALTVVTALAILGQLGVDIGPLIAGAGIFGVAIGFGSQALVRDVISGFFYLFDDAFRVGEYIQAKSYKGTVEGFSLRSVRLRHHRGPIFTVPFGELGAVENMSRDWSKIKFVITVPYDTDLEKARKIAKTIGQSLLEDPEFGPLFIQPLKLKGVEEFGEYGIVVSFAMVTVPSGQQSFIRRSAFARLRDAFQEAGITFAQPTVQVGSTSSADAAAAALAHRNASRPPEPELLT